MSDYENIAINRCLRIKKVFPEVGLLTGREFDFEELELISKKGRKLVLYHYESDGSSKGTIIHTSAMGVRQYYYRYFATFLSQHGYDVYTFDYSGIGASSVESLKKSNITIKEWSAEISDVISEVDEMRNRSLPFYYLSHSLGGQLFGLLEQQELFDKMVAVTSQNGYWRYYRNKWRYIPFWYIIFPITIAFWGYLPAKLLGFGENLPAAVGRRWKKWCTSENYFFEDEDYQEMIHYPDYHGPLLTIGFDDDPWATEEAIHDLYQRYVNAHWEHWQLSPKVFGLDEIGHLGYYIPKSEEIWNRTISWLQNDGK